MKMLVFIILLMLLSFSSKGSVLDSLRKVNNVKSITLIIEHFENDRIKTVDTLNDCMVFNQNGKIKHERYSVGALVLHKYFYDTLQNLIVEIRLTPPPTFPDEFIYRKQLNLLNYTDTMTIISYTYDERGRVSNCSKYDNWGIFQGIVEFNYNDRNQLISKYEIDSFGNFGNFEIHKYLKNGNKIYSLYNNQLMTAETIFNYKNGNNLTLTHTDHHFRDNRTRTTYRPDGVFAQEKKNYHCEKLNSITNYVYHENGLVHQILEYHYEEGVRMLQKRITYNYTYF